MIESFLSLPAIAKILSVFAGIFVLSRLRVPMGASLFIASLALGIWFQKDPVETVEVAIRASGSEGSLSLLAMIVLITLFSASLRLAGQLQAMVESLRSVVGSIRVRLMALPALIGLLPMPGGALFSAPMIGTALEGQTIAPECKAQINYFFRHIWEPFWPLYPGVILFISLSGLDLGKLMVAALPITPVMILVGYLAFLRNHPFAPTTPPGESRAQHWLKSLLPLFVVFGTIAIAKIGTHVGGPAFGGSFGRYFPIYLGMLAGIIWVCTKHRIRLQALWMEFTNGKTGGILFMVLGLMAFKAVTEASGAIKALQGDLSAYGVPLQVAVVFLPWLSGIIFGFMFSTVAASFPLITPLITDTALSTHTFFYLAIGYTAGFFGMLTSPLHVCLIVSGSHFGATYKKIYPRLLLAIYASAFLSAAYLVGLLMLGWA